jgi:PadR family transcriptional regulator AphA
MSGYDIKRFLKSPSFGSVYSALHALQKDGLATVEVIPRQSRPPRKIYSITAVGRQVLKEWIDVPVTSSAPLKAFAMRLALVSDSSHAGLIALLQQRRAQVATHHAVLEQTAGTMNEQTDLGQRLALDYGLALALAELAWLDGTMYHFLQPLPMEVVQGGTAASIA